MKNCYFLCLLMGCAQTFAQDKETVHLDDMLIHDRIWPGIDVEKAPFSVNHYRFEALAERNIGSVQDVADDVPNLSVMDSGSRSYFDMIGVRGLTNTPLFGAPSVVFYVDDVPYANPATNANRLYGVENIEVYRGPQGTLFGKNSYGGVFNVKTRRPTNEMKGKLFLEGGSHDYGAANAFLNGPLIKDQLYFNLGGAYTRRDGFLKNSFLGTRPDDQEHSSGRASLTWKPSTRWNISLTGTLDDFNDGTPRFVLLGGDPFKVNSDLKGKQEQNADSQALRTAYAGEGYEVLSVTARRNWELNPLLLDGDLTPVPMLAMQFNQDQYQYSQEFRIRSKKINADWDWSAGIFASTSKINQRRLLTLLEVFEENTRSQFEEDNYALFGQLSYNALNNIRLYAGLRLDYVDKRFKRTRQDPFLGTIPRLDDRDDYFYVSPKLGIDYQLSDKALLYANTGLAYKPGGFVASTDMPSLAEFDKERLWSSELGVKTKWVDDSIEANLALFYYDIKDYQLERFTSPVDFTVVNVPEVTSYGLEVELQAELWEGLTAESAFGYTHSEFEKYRDPASGKNLAGNKVPYVPRFNMMLATQYKHPTGFFARAELVWTGDVYYDDNNTSLLQEGDYAVVNTRAGYTGKWFGVYAYANNLANDEHYTFIVNNIPAGIPGDPRTAGVNLSVKF